VTTLKNIPRATTATHKQKSNSAHSNRNVSLEPSVETSIL